MSAEKNYNQKSRGCGKDYSSGNGNEGGNHISRSRALGVIALMTALFIFQVTVFFVNAVKELPVHNTQPQDSVSSCTNSKKEKGLTEYPNHKTSKNKKPAERFEFDPNSISLDSLCLLGFSPKQAQTILNYRSKGGVFRKREDFAKMYVVSEELYLELSSYIVIDRQNTQDSKAYLLQNNNNALQKTEANSANRANKPDTVKQKKVFDNRPLIVELNSADSVQLVKLYGIGGYYAKKIIAYRNRVGNFYAPEQLMEIDGMDSLRYAGFAKNVTADPAAVRRFRLDTAGKHFLIRHPYIGAYAARGIILMREKIGTAACTLQNLVKEKVLSPQTAEKLWYYIIE